MKPKWTYEKNAKNVALKAKEKILLASKKSIRQKGVFSLVLAGGTTPRNIYQLLADSSLDWNHTHLYLGDERCLSPKDPDRNSYMIKETLINNIIIPEENIKMIPSEKGAEMAAELYKLTILPALPFDMVLLGMGEDGHTASLFPGYKHDTNEITHAIYDAPKPPTERVTLSSKTLSNSKDTLILVTGKNKRNAVKAWQSGNSLPISDISAITTLEVIIDQEATPKSA